MRQSDRGLSPVVGVAFLLVVTLLLVVSSAVVLVGFSRSLQQPAPVAVIDRDVTVEVRGNDTGNRLDLVHRGGQSIPVAHLRVVLDDGNGTASRPVPANGSLADGEWTTGETVTLHLDEDEVCSGDDTVDVTLVVERGESSQVVSSQTVRVERGQFVISGGSVRPSVDFTARVTLLGSAITTGAGTPVPVDVWVTVGGNRARPWDDVAGNANLPQNYSVPNRAAGTNISVRAQAQGVGRPPVNSTAGGGLVSVLRDGDDAPDTQGFRSQANASSFIAPYLDDGTVSLADNQAIFLFELGTDDPTAAAADFQDAVVLVSLSASEETVVTRSTGAGGVVVCSGGG